MPTEAAPDRHTEIAANRTAEAAERSKLRVSLDPRRSPRPQPAGNRGFST